MVVGEVHQDDLAADVAQRVELGCGAPARVHDLASDAAPWCARDAREGRGLHEPVTDLHALAPRNSHASIVMGSRWTFFTPASRICAAQ